MSGRRSPSTLIAAALVLLAVAGCGSTIKVAGDGLLELGLDEYRVLPQDVHADAGPLTILVHNYGRLTHDLVITRNGITEASTKPIPPGQTVELDTTLAPGSYVMASSLLSDQALGAYGTLDVGSR